VEEEENYLEIGLLHLFSSSSSSSQKPMMVSRGNQLNLKKIEFGFVSLWWAAKGPSAHQRPKGAFEPLLRLLRTA